jgi:uracil-DNA glycosylase
VPKGVQDLTDDTEDRIRIEPQWKEVLKGEFSKESMQKLREFLIAEKARGKVIFPPNPEIFTAFNSTPFDRVKVVILGQDPYHGPHQAHGLSFSVPVGVRPPPSLMNIYKELKSDLGIPPPPHGHLKHWADQGVLLLNSVLTVEQDKAGSHQNKGWEILTDAAIRELNVRRENLVFILWGAYAQKKGQFIDRQKHCVIESVHPSPLSAHRGFFGSKPFSKTNNYLLSKGLAPIDWQLM